MITFDLACDTGHRFEGWFRSREDFEEQLGRGLVACPLCGSSRVTKQLSAVAVHVSRRSSVTVPPSEGAQPAVPEPRPSPQALFQVLSAFVETHFEDVGASFAREARRIETGDAEARNIRGTTTAAEEEALRDEGVEFMKIALPKYDA